MKEPLIQIRIIVVCLISGVAALQAMSCTPVGSERHQPSGVNSTFSFEGETFREYVEFSRQMVVQGRTDLSQGQGGETVAGNGPYFLEPPSSCPPGLHHPYEKGILLVHGLSDSPYMMRGLARFFQRECFYVQALLLPGHGTRPGDLLNVTRMEWKKAHTFGVRTLKELVDRAYLGGLSTGAALNIQHALADREIRALFLFSPAIEITAKARISCWMSALGTIIPRLAWLGKIQPDEDPFKYESFAANAACEVYRLTKEIEDARGTSSFQVPVFVAASYDDATVNVEGTLRFFGKIRTGQKKMLLYARGRVEVPRGVEVVESSFPGRKIASSTHMAIVVPPEDTHYGDRGRYSYCLHYYGRNEEAFSRCKAREEDFLGEIGEEFLNRGVVRRLTFNPRYEEMIEKMRSFLAEVDQ